MSQTDRTGVTSDAPVDVAAPGVEVEPADVTVPGPRVRVRSVGVPAGPALSARRTVVLVLATLTLLTLVDAHGLRRTAENMPAGWPRSTLLAVGRPADDVSRATHVDGPRRLIYWAFGHDDGSGASSELLAPATDLSAPAAPPLAAPAAGPDRGKAPRHASALPPLRHVTAAAPLRLLVTGDSMSGPLAPALSDLGHGTLHVDVQTKYSTGLVRPDFFDWAANARKQVASVHPEAVVLTLGGNDGQGFSLPGGTVYSAGSASWVREYSRRATILLRIYSQGGRVPVYWMSLPVARSGQLDGYFRGLNTAIQAAVARVPRAHFIDIRDRLSKNGSYSAYVPDDRGKMVLAREGDGVHLSDDGSRIAAPTFLKAIDTDWHI